MSLMAKKVTIAFMAKLKMTLYWVVRVTTAYMVELGMMFLMVGVVMITCMIGLETTRF